MQRSIFTYIFFQLFFCSGILSQKYLPQFSVIELNANRNKISWLNPHKNCVQLSIQRSTDSLKNFTTILSAKTPELEENSYIDYMAPLSGRIYYKIFYALNGGNYFFSDVVGVGKAIIKDKKLLNEKNTRSNAAITNWGDDDIDLFLADESKSNSTHVYTERGGYLVISLPQAKIYQYKLIIFDNDHSVLYETGKITDTKLILEKGNFYRVGYYKYELFENGKLIERSRFYIGEN